MLAQQLTVALENLRPLPRMAGGVLVAPGRVDRLAEALERLVRSHGERRRMGRAARRKVEENYDVDRSAARMRAVLEDELGLRFGDRP